jgi:hypothetical protein
VSVCDSALFSPFDFSGTAQRAPEEMNLNLVQKATVYKIYPNGPGLQKQKNCLEIISLSPCASGSDGVEIKRVFWPEQKILFVLQRMCHF